MTKLAHVSSFGRIKTTQGVITKPNKNADGYPVTRINKKLYRVHRIMAYAFKLHKPLESYTQVNHKDLDRSNNHISNLEWTTPSENNMHSYKNNISRKSCALKTSKSVQGREIGSSVWTEYTSTKEVGKILNLNHGSVSLCANGKTKRAGKYEFKWIVTETVIEGEVWRTINNICISNTGRHKNQFGVISTPLPRTNGYCQVGTGSKGKNTFKTYLLHRLVAEAFLPKPSELHIEVNHKDRNPSNNHVSNLEWVTKAENIRHSFETNKNRTSNATKMSKPLRGRKKNTDMWTLYPSSMEAARILNLPQGNIASCARGERKIVEGYEFEWAEGDEPELLEGEEWREIDDTMLALLDASK